jgi:hypothetical protein
MSGRWLLKWALRLSLYTNPLRQCSHLNGRLSSGRWCVICFSYVSSLASSFPHSWHLKEHTYISGKWHNKNWTKPNSQANMMLHICILVPSSIFWSILLFLYVKAWNITRIVTYTHNCIMQILALTGDEQEGLLFKIYQSEEKHEEWTAN